MIKIRESSSRGHSDLDWLHSMHTFSFSEYFDPAFSGFGTLRVINEDTVQPGKGFGMHSHRDMEIISYVIRGGLEHKDSLGTGSIIRPGEIQRMTAGSGVMHSEFNHSDTEPVHFLQIWIIPNKQDLQPSYEQKSIVKLPNQWILIGDSRGDEQVVKIHQDVKIMVAYLTRMHSLEYSLANKRKAWFQLVAGEVQLQDKVLNAGDGAAITNEHNLHIVANSDAEFLLFDLA